jgi:hypothetical protein
VFDANSTMLRVTAVPEVARAGYTVLGWRVSDIAAMMRGLTAAAAETAACTSAIRSAGSSRNTRATRRIRSAARGDGHDPHATGLLCNLPTHRLLVWADCCTKAPVLAVDITCSYRSHSPENPMSTPQSRLCAPASAAAGNVGVLLAAGISGIGVGYRR